MLKNSRAEEEKTRHRMDNSSFRSTAQAIRIGEAIRRTSTHTRTTIDVVVRRMASAEKRKEKYYLQSID